eukprot:4007828-Pleurochrysis_carterae.AAC.6
MPQAKGGKKSLLLTRELQSTGTETHEARKDMRESAMERKNWNNKCKKQLATWKRAPRSTPSVEAAAVARCTEACCSLLLDFSVLWDSQCDLAPSYEGCIFLYV